MADPISGSLTLTLALSGNLREKPDTLALRALFNAVVTRFASDSTAAANHFGWREPTRQLGDAGGRGNRIVWVPGDPNGNLGPVVNPREPGKLPHRPIGTLEELFHCQITGYEPSDPELEIDQYETTRLLFDAWWRAVYLYRPNLISLRGSSWITEKTTRRRGATIQVVCTILAMIPDAQYQGAPVDTAATIASKLLDVSESIEVPAP